MKTWKPDTCECHVEEIYDQDGNITGGGQVLNKCAAHADVPDEDLYGVLMSNPDGENKRKNFIERLLLGYDTVQTLGLHDEIVENGQTIHKFKDGISYNWSWVGTGDSRVLQIQVEGITLTQPQRNAIENWIENKFGIDKVELL